MSAVGIAAAFLLNGLAVAALAPPALARLTEADLPALPALLAWLGAMAAAAMSAVAAAAIAGLALVQAHGDLHNVLVGCLEVFGDAWHGHYGNAARIALTVSAALATAVAGFLVGRLFVLLHRAHARTSRHCQMAWLIGDSQVGPDGTLLVDTPHSAVYCVAGRRPAIVVTRGALDALDGDQLTAVLAHERAHLAGRHHLLMAVTRAAAAVLPRVRLFTDGARAIAHLVEVRADELAVRRSDRTSLASAMLTLAGAGPLPAAALGASDIGVAQRVERLLSPTRATGHAYRRALGHATLALTGGPAVTAAAMLGVPLLCRALGA